MSRILASLPVSKKRQHLELLIEDSETVEFRLESMVKGFNDIQQLEVAAAKERELGVQKTFTESLKRQLAELK